MKAEAMLYSIAMMLVASTGDKLGLPPDQALFLWSVAGTSIGASVAAINMPNGTTWIQRGVRALMSLLAGMILAPYAIGMIPRPELVPHWWHAFGASGIAAFVSYVLVAEGHKFFRKRIKEHA